MHKTIWKGHSLVQVEMLKATLCKRRTRWRALKFNHHKGAGLSLKSKRVEMEVRLLLVFLSAAAAAGCCRRAWVPVQPGALLLSLSLISQKEHHSKLVRLNGWSWQKAKSRRRSRKKHAACWRFIVGIYRARRDAINCTIKSTQYYSCSA